MYSSGEEFLEIEYFHIKESIRSNNLFFALARGLLLLIFYILNFFFIFYFISIVLIYTLFACPLFCNGKKEDN